MNVLKPLVSKESHGLYVITEIGKKIAEDAIIVSETKPIVQKEKRITQTEIGNIPLQEKVLDFIWLQWPSFVGILFVLITTILLGLQGIALAGSAIYAVGSRIVFAFDVLAFLLGFIALYSVENLLRKYSVYNQAKFTLTIRCIAMLPATLVGLSLLLLFSVGISPSQSAYNWIFAITLLFGYLVSVSGTKYLRAVSTQHALHISLIPIMVDLLLGIVVLLSI